MLRYSKSGISAVYLPECTTATCLEVKGRGPRNQDLYGRVEQRAAKSCPEEGPFAVLSGHCNSQIVDYVAGGARVQAKLRNVPGPPVTSFPRKGKAVGRGTCHPRDMANRVLKSDIIAIKTCHRHCQPLVHFNFAVAECFLIVSCFIRSFSRSGTASTCP